MNNHFDASPFSAGFSAAVVEHLAQARAIFSLSMRVDSDGSTDSTRRTAQAAALSMVNAAVSQLTFGAGADALAPDVIAQVNDSLTKAQAVISVVANNMLDLDAIDDLELASNAAIDFLQEAMENLEQEAA